eukprot:PhF_6_TR17400/c0_g1_i2/m.26636
MTTPCSIHQHHLEQLVGENERLREELTMVHHTYSMNLSHNLRNVRSMNDTRLLELQSLVRALEQKCEELEEEVNVYRMERKEYKSQALHIIHRSPPLLLTQQGQQRKQLLSNSNSPLTSRKPPKGRHSKNVAKE